MLDYPRRLSALRYFHLGGGATTPARQTMANWLLTTIPNNKRIFTIETAPREVALIREETVR